MKTLTISWQRLVADGETCPRCGETGEELTRAINLLKKSLAPLGIEVVSSREELTVAEFKENPLESNRIWLNDRPLEDWLDAGVGQSECCDVCGPSDCRTTEIEGKTYETIPAHLIIKAGLLAAIELIDTEIVTESSCCSDKSRMEAGTGCCGD